MALQMYEKIGFWHKLADIMSKVSQVKLKNRLYIFSSTCLWYLPNWLNWAYTMWIFESHNFWPHEGGIKILVALKPRTSFWWHKSFTKIWPHWGLIRGLLGLDWLGYSCKEVAHKHCCANFWQEVISVWNDLSRVRSSRIVWWELAGVWDLDLGTKTNKMMTPLQE